MKNGIRCFSADYLIICLVQLTVIFYKQCMPNIYPNGIVVVFVHFLSPVYQRDNYIRHGSSMVLQVLVPDTRRMDNRWALSIARIHAASCHLGNPICIISSEGNP
jgi:hypothetical protein